MPSNTDDPYYNPETFRATRTRAADRLVGRLLALTEPEKIPDPPGLSDIPHWAFHPYPEPEPEEDDGK